MDDGKPKDRSSSEVSVFRSHTTKPKQRKHNLEQWSTSAKKRGERLSSAIKNLPVMVNAFDVCGNIIVWNRECEQITGYTKSEITSNPRLMEMLHQDAASHMHVTEEMIEHYNSCHHWRSRFTCKDGNDKDILWFNLSEYLPIQGWIMWHVGFDISGQEGQEKSLSLLLKAISNIDEKETNETIQQLWSPEKGELLLFFIRFIVGSVAELHEEVRRLQGRIAKIDKVGQKVDVLQEDCKRYRSLISGGSEVAWTIDNKGDLTFITSNVQKVCGFSLEEIYKQGYQLLFERVHPEDVAKVKEAYKALFEKGATFDIEYRIRKKEGEWTWLRDRSIKTYEKNGVIYAEGFFSDITESKKTNQSLDKETIGDAHAFLQ